MGRAPEASSGSGADSSGTPPVGSAWRAHKHHPTTNIRCTNAPKPPETSPHRPYCSCAHRAGKFGGGTMLPPSQCKRGEHWMHNHGWNVTSGIVTVTPCRELEEPLESGGDGEWFAAALGSLPILCWSFAKRRCLFRQHTSSYELHVITFQRDKFHTPLLTTAARQKNGKVPFLAHVLISLCLPARRIAISCYKNFVTEVRRTTTQAEYVRT